MQTCLFVLRENCAPVVDFAYRRRFLLEATATREWGIPPLARAVRLVVACGVLVALTALPARAQWTEVPDAPDLIPGQNPVGSGALTTITGTLRTSSINDFVDMYCINIPNPSAFSATLSPGATEDNPLFLFDPLGIGITYQEGQFSPAGGGPTPSSIGFRVSPNGLFVPPLPPAGKYYLAIGTEFVYASNSLSQYIWDWSTNIATAGLETEPNGPGQPGPLASWLGTGGAAFVGGAYTITLTGTEFCESAPDRCQLPEPPDDICRDLWATECDGASTELCRPTQLSYDPMTGVYTTEHCACINEKECYLEYIVGNDLPECRGRHCPGTNRACALTATTRDNGTITFVCCSGTCPQVRQIPDLDTITFWEGTNTPKPHTFQANSSQLNSRLTTLGSGSSDFVGVPTAEFYDVFYSDWDGTPNFTTGQFVTIEAVYDSAAAGGGLNIGRVDLNFIPSAPLRYANSVASFFGNGTNYIPWSELRAVDNDSGPVPLTYTEMGNTFGIAQRLRVTVGFPCGCEPPPSGMVAWWPMDELTNATDVVDIVGPNNSNGTPKPFGSVGSPNGPNPVLGQVSGALQMASNGEYVEVPALNALDLNFGTGPFSIDAWVNVSLIVTQTEPIVHKLNAGGGYFLYIYYPTGGSTNYLELNIDGVPFIGPPITSPQGWIFVAATRSANGVNLYVGQSSGWSKAGPFGVGALSASSVADLLIGRNTLNPHSALAIDELEIFNVELTENQIRDIYEAGSAGKCKDCKALPDGSGCTGICKDASDTCKPTQFSQIGIEEPVVSKCDCVSDDQCSIATETQGLFQGLLVCEGVHCPFAPEMDCPDFPIATVNPFDNTTTYECCPKDIGLCPLEGNLIPYDPCAYLHETCDGGRDQACLPTKVMIYDSPVGGQPGSNYPRAEECACAEQFTGPCGPVTIKADPGGTDYALSCFGTCPPNTIPSQCCQVLLQLPNGIPVPQGQVTLFVQSLPIGAIVTCDCVSCPDPCEDGVFCNGVETAGPNGNCVAGDPPCAVDFLCDEEHDTCQPAIPTVSQWGLVVLTLLLLIGAKIYFARRQTATAA